MAFETARHDRTSLAPADLRNNDDEREPAASEDEDDDELAQNSGGHEHRRPAAGGDDGPSATTLARARYRGRKVRVLAGQRLSPGTA